MPKIRVRTDPATKVAPVPIGAKWWVPARFTALIDDPSLGYAVRFEVRVGSGSGVRVLNVEIGLRDQNIGSVSASGLRGLTLNTYLRLAIEDVRKPRTNLPDGTFSIDGSDSTTRYGGRAVRAPGRGRAMDDDFLRQVATTYREAVASGSRSPVEAVQKLGGSRSSAGRWVGQARDKGFLGAAIGPTVGEKERKQRRNR